MGQLALAWQRAQLELEQVLAQKLIVLLALPPPIVAPVPQRQPWRAAFAPWRSLWL